MLVEILGLRWAKGFGPLKNCVLWCFVLMQLQVGGVDACEV